MDVWINGWTYIQIPIYNEHTLLVISMYMFYQQMLVYNSGKRMSAKTAMQHPYFSDLVRQVRSTRTIVSSLNF